MNKIKLICFDVDGTLVEGNSWLRLTEGLGCLPEEHNNLYIKCRKGELSFIEGQKILKEMYQLSGNANSNFINNLFNKTEIKEGVKDLISYLKRKGYLIYLISSSIDIYVGLVAEKIVADGFYANSSLEFDNEGILKKIIYQENEGELKVEHLRDLIKKLGITMDQVVFIGDSDNDIEAFEVTKQGIAVNSSSDKLKKVSWKIVHSLEEIKNIL